MSAHSGYAGMKRKFAIRLMPATVTPTVRARMLPLNTPMPAEQHHVSHDEVDRPALGDVRYTEVLFVYTTHSSLTTPMRP